MKNKHSFIVPWITYPFDVMINVGTTTEDVIKKITKLGYELNDIEKKKLEMHGVGRTVMLDGGQTIIILKKYDQAIMAHEIFHAVCMLFDKIGINFSEDSDEAYAYAIEYLTREVNRKII